MNFPPPEGAGALGVPKFAQQSEPRPTATTGDSTPAPPAIELYKEEEPKRQQYKDIDVMAEGNAAPKAVRSEKRQPARKRKTAEKKAQGEAEAADKPSEIPQATIVSIYCVFSGPFITICACLGSRSPGIEKYSRKCCESFIWTVHKQEEE